MKKLLLLLLIPTLAGAETKSLDQAILEMWGEANGKDVIFRCDTYSRNPKHCKIVHTFVAKAESNLCKDAHRNNCYGNSKYKFTADWQATERFNKTYNKFYYKNLTPSDFYSNNPKRKPKTRYCMSENSSGSKGACPNGYNTAWKIYNYLINLE